MSAGNNEQDEKPGAGPEAGSEIRPDPGQSVGYGQPPNATRFKKGCSGNPKGRPKGSLNVATTLIKTLRERVVINENGQRRTITKLEAAIKQIVNKAASGDHRALRLLLESARDAELKQSASVVPTPEVSEIDREVMEDILRRFQPEKEEEKKENEQPSQEANSDDTHSS